MNLKNIKHDLSISAALAVENKSLSKIEQALNYLTFNKLFSKKKNVVVLSFNGMIVKSTTFKSHFNFEGMLDLIDKAFSNSNSLAVCLVINSPGGSPVQTELITNRIKNLSIEKKIPVYSFVEDIAASGGYWLACAGEEIYASKSSIVGSIGVVTSGFGLQDAIHKLGIERRIITSGKNKSVLDPFKPVKEDDIRIIIKLQESVHKHFIEHVKKNRGNRLTQNDDILFNGEFWSGETALDYGLIDGIDDMHNFVKQKFGKEIKIEYVTPKKSWIKSKIGVNQDHFAENLVDIFLEKLENKIENSSINLK